MISGGSASTNNSSSSNSIGASNVVSTSLHTTTTPTNSNDVVPNNNTLIQQQQSSLTSFLTLQTGAAVNNNNNTTTTTILASGESPQQASHHVIVVGGGNTTSLLPPLAKSTPIMTSTTLNGTSAANQSSHSTTTTATTTTTSGGGSSSSTTTNTPQFVPIAPATSNQHNSLLSVPSAHTSDHATEHHKSVPSNSSLNVSISNLPPNVPSSQQARSPKPVQVGFVPPVSLCVLMEQMASKIQQHYQPQKQTSSSKKSELSSQKKDVIGESSSTLNSNTEDAKKTENMSTDDKTNNQSNETNANVTTTSRNVSSTSQGRSRSPGSNSTPSLYDILNDEYHSNYPNYQELIHATNLIVEFLYGNTDLRERYHPFHSQFSSQQNPSFSWVYVLPPGMVDQNPPIPAVPRAPPTYAHSGLPNQHSTPVKSGRGVPRSETTPNSNFKSSSSTTGYDPLEIPPPVFAMPKPSNGSEASTPMRVRIAPNSAGGTAILPMPEHQHISPFPIRAKEEDLMEEDKRRRRIGKKPETQEGGAATGNDEQENKFVCYICDKSVVDKSTKYTLTSSNFSSFHEVFPHLKTPLLGESKRICANCYHKKYRNSRKKKADDRKDVISQGSSNVMSVDESYEPAYCCCVCKKNGSEEFTETNFVNVQNYRSYLTYFPFISDTPTADRQLPVCDLCHANYLQADIQEKKRKFIHMMPNLPNTVETLESLNKKLKPDTSHL